MQWHRTDFEDDMDNIMWITGVMDGKTGTRYDTRAEYMNKYFKADEWNCIVSAIEDRFVDTQEQRTALGKMWELKHKGDIESYLLDTETLTYTIRLVGTPWRTLLRDGLSEDLQYCLSTTQRHPQTDRDCVDCVRMIGVPIAQLLMLQNKLSTKDSSSGFKKKNKKRQSQEEEDQREN